MQVEKEPIRLKPLTDAEIDQIMQGVEDKMNYETTIDLFNALIADSGKIMEDAAPADKIPWFIRGAYLSGYKNGLELYSKVVKNFAEKYGTVMDVIQRIDSPEHLELVERFARKLGS